MRPFPEPWGNYLINGISETAAPNNISWWPTTIGWKILLLVLMIALLRLVYRRYQSYQRNAYRRDALAWLQQLPEYNGNQPDPIYRQLPALLRKTALTAFDRTAISQLSRQQWEVWLDQHCPGCLFVDNCPDLLHQLAYAPEIAISQSQMQTLVTEVGRWIRHHRGPYD